MWKVIENSNFWICISTVNKTITLRFLHPLSSIVHEFSFHFTKKKISLIPDDTVDEKWLLKQMAQIREEKKALK